jgi:hypothetical protein
MMTSPDRREPGAGQPLDRLAARLKTERGFMASALAALLAKDGLTEPRLAQRLRMPAANLARLALCRRPRADQADFVDQVRQIALYAGADANQLARLIRQAEALENQAAAQKAPAPKPGDAGWLPRLGALPGLAEARGEYHVDGDEPDQEDDIDDAA